jgi:hypothetical protein
MQESTNSETSKPRQAPHRHREPLPVGLGGVPPSAPSESPQSGARLGPTDVRLELTFKLSGRDSVFADEYFSTDLPDALNPPHQGMLLSTIDRAVALTVEKATIKTNMAIGEPELTSPESQGGIVLPGGGAKCASQRTIDDYAVIAPPPPGHQKQAAQVPSSQPIDDFPECLPPKPPRKTDHPTNL